MEYRRLNGEFPELSRSAVTLGKFDGVHRGHKKLIEKIVNRREKGEKAVMIAFLPGKQMLFTSEERRKYLESLGIDVLLECPLTPEFCRIQAEEFVKKILCDALDIKYAAVGEDFHFGCGRKGNTELLAGMGEKLGFSVDIVSKEMDGNRRISSSRIREELQQGHMEKAEELLGHPFVVEGFVEHGRGQGHLDFFPTINLVPPEDKLMPPNGVYVSAVHFPHRSYAGVTNVGYKPTIGEKFLGVETYLYNCSEDLYGQYCTVELKRFQRPEMKFDSFESLKNQIRRDTENGLVYWSGNNYLK